MRGRPPKPIEQRFWPKVRKADGCWEWQAAKIGGYGVIKRKDGRHIYAFRLSYEIANGEIPDGLMVLHRCDNRGCVNPDHLFLGTHQDNMDDMVKKGRSAHMSGEKNGTCKLTSDLVLHIRQDARSQDAIAKTLGVSQTLIGKIKRKERWAHLPDSVAYGS